MDFTDQLRLILAERKITHAALAKLVGVEPSFVSLVATRRTRVALDRLEAWADALSLKDRERARFIQLGHLAHSPMLVRDLVSELESDLAKAREQHALLLDEVARITAQRAKPSGKR